MWSCVQLAADLLAQFVSAIGRWQHPQADVLDALWAIYLADMHPQATAEVVQVVHTSFLALPWGKFSPSLARLKVRVSQRRQASVAGGGVRAGFMG